MGILFPSKNHVRFGMLLVLLLFILCLLGSLLKCPVAFADAGVSDSSNATSQTVVSSDQSKSQTDGDALGQEQAKADKSSSNNAQGGTSLAAGLADLLGNIPDDTNLEADATDSSDTQKATGTKKQSMKASAQYGYYYASREALQIHNIYVYYPVNVKNYHGRIRYSNCSTNAVAKKIKVSPWTGRITIPKGYSKSLVTLKIRVCAAGNSKYAAASKVVKLKIRLASKQRGAAQSAVNEWWHGVRNGTRNAGGLKYWSAWYDKRKAWCSEFAGWCLIDSGYVPGVNMPNRPTSALQYMSFYKKNPGAGKIIKVTARTKFKPGDILIRYSKKGKPIHTGMAVKYSSNMLTTIEGNGHDTVVKREYSGKNIKKRWAYCIRLAS